MSTTDQIVTNTQQSVSDITALRDQLHAAIGDRSGALQNTPDLAAEAAPEEPLQNCMLPETAPEHMSEEELTRAIGALRAARDRVDLAPKSVAERPRVDTPAMMTRETTSTAGTWCKVQADGFTPCPRQPSMRIHTQYDPAITVPTQRRWVFLDQFSKKDDVVETWTVKYPCKDLEKVARDITRAWQVYSTPGLDLMDAALLANTPLSVEIDGIRARRYLDIWVELRRRYNDLLPSGFHWRVVRGEIRNTLGKN